MFTFFPLSKLLKKKNLPELLGSGVHPGMNQELTTLFQPMVLWQACKSKIPCQRMTLSAPFPDRACISPSISQLLLLEICQIQKLLEVARETS